MSILLENLTKRYGGQLVVNNLSLEIADGEFFVLLGSSGSGKTTALSMIAGLSDIDSGRILLHGRDVTTLPSQARNVGFVFQNYALFQHMTVADNIEFGLRVRHVGAGERRRRRDELLELVGLAGLGKRLPRQLSGGQQQRVALARALAHRPDVLLLDEPLGALDAKIRTELRRTLRAIQRELGITTIMVTHDQEEAFELADRMGVMSFGRLLEVGEPQALYQAPQTEFVATFLGTANILLGRRDQEGVQLGPRHFPVTNAQDGHSATASERVQVLFRPEEIALAPTLEALDWPLLGQGTVEGVTYAGSFERLRLRMAALAGVRPIAPPTPYGEDAILLESTRSQEEVRSFPLTSGDKVWIGLRHLHMLTHPGLRFLIATDQVEANAATVVAAGQWAQLAHARVTLLSAGTNAGLGAAAQQEQIQRLKEQIGSGVPSLEVHVSNHRFEEAVAETVEQQPCDLLVLPGASPASATVALAEKLLQSGEHHLLILPSSQSVPQHALICVANGEPGKEDILFAGRLLRHWGAQATVLTVLPELDQEGKTLAQTQRFLDKGVRTLSLLEVEAESAVHVGTLLDGIRAKLTAEASDLLVLGAPLPDIDGKVVFSGLIAQLLRTVTDRPILIVRSTVQRSQPGIFAVPARHLQRRKEAVL